MTAKEFLETLPKDSNWELSSIVENAMIEFAKYHVQKALEAATENLEYTTEDHSEPYVVHDSVLNAYPLENIK